MNPKCPGCYKDADVCECDPPYGADGAKEREAERQLEEAVCALWKQGRNLGEIAEETGCPMFTALHTVMTCFPQDFDPQDVFF